MKIAVVILNWNGKNLLQQFLPSVIKFSSEANIYLADNASTDESVAFVRENFPTVKIIVNEINGGYAKGYNDALSSIYEDLLILLNNDVEVSFGWIPPLVKAFNADEALVAAQPKILDYNNKDFFEYAGAAGGFIDALGYPYCRGRLFNTLEKDIGQYEEDTDIFWASGACLVVRNEAIKDLGGFDEDLFAHQEEIDLCWRLQATGGIVKYISDSKVYHLGGGTLQNSNPRKTFFNFRNTLLVLLKNSRGTTVWIKILVRLILDGFAGIHFLFQGKPKHFFAILRGHMSFYRLLPKFIRKRNTAGRLFQYYSIKSIVFQYFMRNNKKFEQL